MSKRRSSVRPRHALWSTLALYHYRRLILEMAARALDTLSLVYYEYIASLYHTDYSSRALRRDSRQGSYSRRGSIYTFK